MSTPNVSKKPHSPAVWRRFFQMLADGFFDKKPQTCERGHEDCLGPAITANQGGCRRDTWADVG